MNARLGAGALALVTVLVVTSTSTAQVALSRLQPPPAGKLYHGVFPGSASGEEDDFTEDELKAYVSAAGQGVAWVYFSHNWYRGREFPRWRVDLVSRQGAVPFIRLMLRSSAKQNVREPRFTLEAIIGGSFDEDLRAWGRAARAYGKPLLVEWGTEMNGRWFSWNGEWHGGGRLDGFGDRRRPDGPERFVAAYRRIVSLMRGVGAKNIAWVWHPNCEDNPKVSWNRAENYYPGDRYVDWVGFSAYGAAKRDEKGDQFVDLVRGCYPRLSRIARRKPIAVLEFGVTNHNRYQKPGPWARAALESILRRRWPKIVAFSWWNERWSNGRGDDTNMRVQDTPELRQVFREVFERHAARLQTRPITRP